MSSRGRTEACRVCGGDLQGNQRRWLFGGQNKKFAQPHTPTKSLGGGSLSPSSQSSMWGSTLSLGSLASLSKSQLSLSPSPKVTDLLSVLTHILGQPVSRGSGWGEFLCGKCVNILERVYKFDGVITRVKALSYERLQKLTQERDKMRQWVRHSYHHRNPRDSLAKGSLSEEEGDEEKEGYREMLKENMAHSEYEFWSEKWDACPYFSRTGKRCRKGKGCAGCNALRVSDSDYESVCGVPRHLFFQPFSPLSLSRDKSQSMPLHWSRAPSLSSSQASLAGSSLSLRASSRAESVQSLDSLDGNDPFDSPGERSVNLALKELKRIEGKPVSSPTGSKIPVLSRKEGRSSGQVGGTVSPEVVRVLNLGVVENGVNGGDGMDGEGGDVLTELRDEFMSLHHENPAGRLHNAIRHLRGQLDQAASRIRTLESQLKHGSIKPLANTENNGSGDWTSAAQKEDPTLLLSSLGLCLHDRERLIQECMCLIRRLCVEGGAGPELVEKLTGSLRKSIKESLSENKAALEGLGSEMLVKQKRMESEMEAMRKAGRDRERDLNTLNTVLQCNQDVINALRLELGQKERGQGEFEKETEVWRQRDQALTAVLQEKDALLRCLQGELESCRNDVQALSDSVIGQGLSGGRAEAALANQLREKDLLMAVWVKDREEKGSAMWQEITKLTATLQDYQALVQSHQDSDSQALSLMTEQLGDSRQELRQAKERERARQSDEDDRQREESRLKESLEKRDGLIEQILSDAEQRDNLFRELQQNLQNKFEPMTAVKHTL